MVAPACSSGARDESPTEFGSVSAAVKPAQPGEKGCSKKIDCDDGNVCTDDACVRGRGCQHLAVTDGLACDDANACTHVDACSAGACVGTDAVVCGASDQCHVAGTCNPSTGSCDEPAAADGTACNDGIPCTRPDACSAGVCAGAIVVCDAPDACHLAGVCAAQTGVCVDAPNAPEGVACEDGDACTTEDSCGSGVCSSGPGYVCPAPAPAWLRLSAGNGVATAVWATAPHAGSYVVDGDNPASEETASACAGGVCGAQLQVAEGESSISVVALNDVGLSDDTTTTVTSSTTSAPLISSVSARPGQFQGTLRLSLAFEMSDAWFGDITLIEIDPATGADHVAKFGSSCTDPFGGCGGSDVRCFGSFCSWEVSGSLTPGAHVYQLSPYGQAGARSLPFYVEIPVPDSTPPLPPTSLRIDHVEQRAITLAWEKSSSPDAASYHVTALRGTAPAFADTSAPTTCDATICKQVVGDLYWGVEYTLQVRTVDAAGNESSPVMTNGTPGTSGALSAPTIVELSGDDGMLHVRFTAPSQEGAARFHVYYRPAAGGSEADAGFPTSYYDAATATFCESYSPLHCETWITGLSAVPYVVQLQSEGAPGNFGPRSVEAAATPGPAAPARMGWPDLCGYSSSGIHFSIAKDFDYLWSRNTFLAPDVTTLLITVREAVPVVDSQGRWLGTYDYRNVVTSFDVASACDERRSRCSGAITFANVNLSITSSWIHGQAVDANGNVSQLIQGPSLLAGVNKSCPR